MLMFVFLLAPPAGLVVPIGYARDARGMQGDVLLGDEAGADAGAEVLIEEVCDLCGRDILAALEEAPGRVWEWCLVGS